MYGAQTLFYYVYIVIQFENDVEMYGAQTLGITARQPIVFENDVEMYGAQTIYKERVMQA